MNAQPLFKGHYQPHIPGELGFYDLRVPEVREAQALLAREYGIDGFVYYHYWFNGHRLINRPLDEVVDSGSPDFPFCICWANENWTRVWDGGEQHVLAAQHYSEDDDIAHIRWLLPVLSDPRYITVDSKPLLLIYRVSHLPNPARTAELWRREAERAGLPGLYMCSVQSFDKFNPDSIGFDAAVEFQPDADCLGPLRFASKARSAARRLLRPKSPLRVNTFHSYEELVRRSLARPPSRYRQYRCVTPSWDNAARRSRGARVVVGSTPELYERWLRSIVESFQPYSDDENLLFVNAWNEWGEGNHLEPDRRWGRAYLEAHRQALS